MEPEDYTRPTMHLRWVQRGSNRILQQLWNHSDDLEYSGDGVWKDIPFDPDGA